MAVFCRCLALTVVLIAEILYLTIRFDTRGLDCEPRWWASWMGEVHWLPRFAIAMAAAILLFAGKALWKALPDLALERQPLRRFGLALFGHLLTYAAFTQVTVLIFEGDTREAADAGLWVVAWWVLGFLTVAFLFAGVLPLALWGRYVWRGRWVLAASATVATMACAFGWATDFLWRPLGEATLWTIVGLLKTLGVEPLYDANRLVIGTPGFAVRIAPACSGYEGIGLFWTFIGIYLWVFRKTLCFPQALLLVPLGTLLMWCCNALRIAGLIAVGSWGSEAVALGGFHSQVGWLTFNAVALGLVAGSQRLGFFTRGSGCEVLATPPENGPSTSRDGAATCSIPAAFLAPFLAVLATGMITNAFTTDFDYYYPLRLLVGGAILYYYRHAYAELRWAWSWPAVATGAAVFVLWTLLDQFQAQPGSGTVTPGALVRMERVQATTWLLLRVIGYVLLTPVVEELAFRGYLTSLLAGDRCRQTGQFTWPSFIVPSLFFGIFHQGHWLAGCVAGLAYALALYRRRRLLDAVLAHATTNALIACYVLGTERWSLWG